jgi:hypothetical protein
MPRIIVHNYFAQDSGFNEQAHPRAPSGEFGSGGGGKGPSNSKAKWNLSTQVGKFKVYEDLDPGAKREQKWKVDGPGGEKTFPTERAAKKHAQAQKLHFGE